MKVSWVIPCYNEEEVIEKTVREVAFCLARQPFEYEIIAINNISTDRTREILMGLVGEFPRLRVLDGTEKGKGSAVKLGMLAATGDIRLFSDADNSTSPNHFEKFLPFLCYGENASRDCYDIVIGSIEVPGAVVEEHAQWYRRMLGKLSKYVIRAVSGLWDVRDSQRGFKMFSKKAAEIVFSRQTLKIWGFDFEILLIAKRHGLKIKEVPVRWNNPAGSKVKLSSYITTLEELITVRLNAQRGVYD
ncbi:MAG: glycosyltransferase family 2 protein [Candidatus Sungbacteria bacterium]|nr:glycosyltransferase family 2 protein [Candidatus Sungbacteria bacterium]